MKPTLGTLLGILLLCGWAGAVLAAPAPPGTPYAWGLNTSGQLGDGTTTERHTPVPVRGLTEVVAVAAGP